MGGSAGHFSERVLPFREVRWAETLALLVPPTPEGGFQINAIGTNLMEELLEKI